MWPTVKTVVRRLIRNTTFQRGRHSKLHPNEFLLKTDAEWAENKHTAVRWHTTDSAMRAVLIDCIRKHKLNEAFEAYKVRVAKRESEQSLPIQPPSTVNAVRSTIAGQVPSSPVTLDASIEALVEAKVEESFKHSVKKCRKYRMQRKSRSQNRRLRRRTGRPSTGVWQGVEDVGYTDDTSKCPAANTGVCDLSTRRSNLSDPITTTTNRRDDRGKLACASCQCAW